MFPEDKTTHAKTVTVALTPALQPPATEEKLAAQTWLEGAFTA